MLCAILVKKENMLQTGKQTDRQSNNSTHSLCLSELGLTETVTALTGLVELVWFLCAIGFHMEVNMSHYKR